MPQVPSSEARRAFFTVMPQPPCICFERAQSTASMQKKEHWFHHECKLQHQPHSVQYHPFVPLAFQLSLPCPGKLDGVVSSFSASPSRPHAFPDPNQIHVHCGR
ncbi:hypothetical protein L3X38_043389 [Prunus dulcis]|uniref:Uncharacterized protein n=1 Tax=Prunus dulcis TaxID=3755 RepID=A0AAD4YMV6_PRUDU|nr:hypothetical protein L3X38_043389 [Prunus dulcis]